MSNNEVFFDEDEVIVSKTDLKGKITYVNDVFVNVSGYSEAELLTQPHSIIRHEHMPRCVFQLLWQRISQGEEIFAYVINKCKNDDFYWVFAHVTPSLNNKDEVIAYHSNRRLPSPDIVREKIIPLYNKLIDIEKNSRDRKVGQAAAYECLIQILTDAGVSYDEFIFSLNT